MKLNIENPKRIEYFVSKSVTSWRIEYIGRDNTEGTYYYTLTDKEDNSIKIGVEIHNETQQMYDPTAPPNDGYVKIYCKDLNQPLKRGCTKFIRVEEFKEVGRVFNTLYDAGRRLTQ
jgi:hypothetical protein